MSSSRPAARPKGRPEPAGPRARPLPPARRAAGRRPPVRRSHGRTQLAPPRARPAPAARRAGGRCPPVRTQAPGEAIRALSTGGTYLHRRLARQYNTRPEGSGQRREPTSIGGLGPRSGRRYDKWRPSFCTGARATRGPLEHARNDRDIRLRLLGVTQEWVCTTAGVGSLSCSQAGGTRPTPRATNPRTGGRPSHAGAQQCDVQSGEHAQHPQRDHERATNPRTGGRPSHAGVQQCDVPSAERAQQPR